MPVILEVEAVVTDPPIYQYSTTVVQFLFLLTCSSATTSTTNYCCGCCLCYDYCCCYYYGIQSYCIIPLAVTLTRLHVALCRDFNWTRRRRFHGWTKRCMICEGNTLKPYRNWNLSSCERKGTTRRTLTCAYKIWHNRLRRFVLTVKCIAAAVSHFHWPVALKFSTQLKPQLFACTPPPSMPKPSKVEFLIAPMAHSNMKGLPGAIRGAGLYQGCGEVPGVLRGIRRYQGCREVPGMWGGVRGPEVSGMWGGIRGVGGVGVRRVRVWGGTRGVMVPGRVGRYQGCGEVSGVSGGTRGAVNWRACLAASPGSQAVSGRAHASDQVGESRAAPRAAAADPPDARPARAPPAAGRAAAHAAPRAAVRPRAAPPPGLPPQPALQVLRHPARARRRRGSRPQQSCRFQVTDFKRSVLLIGASRFGARGDFSLDIVFFNEPQEMSGALLGPGGRPEVLPATCGTRRWLQPPQHGFRDVGFCRQLRKEPNPVAHETGLGRVRHQLGSYNRFLPRIDT